MKMSCLSSVSCCLTAPHPLPKEHTRPFSTIPELHNGVLGAHGLIWDFSGVSLLRGHLSWCEHWGKAAPGPQSCSSGTGERNEGREGGGRAWGCHCPEPAVLSSFLTVTLHQHWADQWTQKWVGSAAQAAQENLPGSSASLQRYQHNNNVILMNNHCCYFNHFSCAFCSSMQYLLI